MSAKGNILVSPLLTEKMTRLTERMEAHKAPRGRYGFIVHRDANRIEIARAVEERYNVAVLSVNTMQYMGKRRSRYTKQGYVQGRTDAYKKAIVTLKPGDKIDFYGNI